MFHFIPFLIHFLSFTVVIVEWFYEKRRSFSRFVGNEKKVIDYNHKGGEIYDKEKARERECVRVRIIIATRASECAAGAKQHKDQKVHCEHGTSIVIVEGTIHTELLLDKNMDIL